MEIINAAITSASSTNSRRPAGQAEASQVNVRQSPELRQPQVQPPAAPRETERAVSTPQDTEHVPLLNNREQATATTIRQTPAPEFTQTQAPSSNQERIEAVPRIEQDTQAAAQDSIEINLQQRDVSVDRSRELAQLAQVRVQQINENRQPIEAPEIEFQRPFADTPDIPAPEIGFQSSALTPAQVDNLAQIGASQLAQININEQLSSSTAQTLQNSGTQLNGVLLPDFANFIGLRASVPASEQVEAVNIEV